MYSMGQPFPRPAGPSRLTPADPTSDPLFFKEREAAGVRYRGVQPLIVMPFKSAMVGWKVRSGAEPDVIDLDVTESAELTPYNESTGPRDPGDGFRWVDQRWQQGRGILVVPPANWQPGDDIMRATAGNVTLIASEDAAELARVASTSAPGRGFVLYEPRNGWQGRAITPGGGPAAKKLPSWVVPVGAGVAAITIGAVAWKALRG